MDKYHKIQSVYKRDPAAKRYLLEGQFSRPEFEYLAENRWTFTEKVDGTNIRVLYHGRNLEGPRIRFAGRGDNSSIPANLFMNLSDTFSPQELAFRDAWGESSVCLYGEGFGPGIQKGGGNYGVRQTFVLFDVCIENGWLKREAVEDIGARLGIPVVPVLGTGTLALAVEMVRGGMLSEWGDFPAEGIVARPATELCTRSGERIITKVKTRDFPA